MKRLYPIIEEKICLGCGKKFKRKQNYFGIQWTKVKYCSHQCFGKILSKIQFQRFKDETVHPKWKGDRVGYYGVHDWITKHYGQPKKCENCGLNNLNKKYHWANLSGNHLRDIKDWKRLCVSCHRLYDYGKTNKKLEVTSKPKGLVQF